MHPAIGDVRVSRTNLDCDEWVHASSALSSRAWARRCFGRGARARHPANRDRVGGGKPEAVNDVLDVGVDGDRASAGGGVRGPACRTTIDEPPRGPYRRRAPAIRTRRRRSGAARGRSATWPSIDEALLLAAGGDDEEVVLLGEIARQLVLLAVESATGRWTQRLRPRAASVRVRPARARSPIRLNASASTGPAILSRPFSARSAS